MPTEPALEVTLERVVEWQAAPDGHTAAEASHELLVTLRAIEASLALEGGGEAGTLSRIEAKLDLLLLMATQTGAPGNPLAGATTMVRLSPDGIAWQAAAPLPTAGARLRLMLQLDPRAPVVLRLPAQVVSVVEGPQSLLPEHLFEVTARFVGLDEAAQDALSAAVFRLHRRALQSKRAPG